MEKSKELTPMQELIEFLDKDLKMHDFSQLPAYEKAKSLLAKEKQVFEDAFEEGFKGKRYTSKELYYNTKYKNYEI